MRNPICYCGNLPNRIPDQFSFACGEEKIVRNDVGFKISQDDKMRRKLDLRQVIPYR
jgi:hypothetical protein